MARPTFAARLLRTSIRTKRQSRAHIQTLRGPAAFFTSSRPSAPSQTGPGTTNFRHAGFVVACLSLAAAAAILTSLALTPSTASTSPSDTRDPSLPRHRLAEIRSHSASHKRPWVTLGDRVYDITDWIPAHPGGDVILRAAGGSIEPFWDIFAIHKTDYVREMLAQFQSGLVHAEDLGPDGLPARENIKDPFSDDPQRDPRLITHTLKPRNAETPAAAIDQTFLTPAELFYVRNHMWVPRCSDDGGSHTLTIELPDGTVKSYTVADLKEKFTTHRVTATLQCSGNRRWDMTWSTAKTNGLQWNVGAISNAEWEGVRLSDVLADAGLESCSNYGSPDHNNKHVQFSALEAYGASIPLHTALDPRGDVLLAFSMNGAPLTPDHGFPLRALVPGTVAARSVKWLNKISVSDEESTTQWQRRDYKCFGPNVRTPDWGSAPAMQEMPVNSAITALCVSPDAQQAAQEGKKVLAVVSGYAYSGGGREVVRVDVSSNDGENWNQARLLDREQPRHGSKAWAWKRWDFQTDVSFDKTKFDGAPRCAIFVAKATDEAYNTQPRDHRDVYNQRGNLATGWNMFIGCLDQNGNVERMKGIKRLRDEQTGKDKLVLIKEEKKP